MKRLARPEIGLPPDTPSDIPEGPQDPEISLGPTDEDLFQDVENEPLVRHHGKLIASVNSRLRLFLDVARDLLTYN